jgi:carboxypeptidase PM20D1
VSVLGLLEAAEMLLGQGFEPSRTIHLAFGHDEEVGGSQGARAIAALLRERDVEPALVLDEGGQLVAGFLPGMERPVATIGIAEKGYLSVELSVRTEGGHSSVPPSQTAIGILSSALHRLENNPVPADLDSVVRQTLDHVGPELPLLPRLVAANLWLFGPLMETALSRSAPTNATIRTTTAATMFEAGVKENILPSAARAVVNFRILPGDTVHSVLDHVRRVVGDPRVDAKPLPNSSEPSPVSPVDGEAFRTLHRTVREIFPAAVVAPSLVLGATDARHYAALTPNVYRFLPILLGVDDVRRFHGIDERLGVEAYATVVRFYARLLRNLAG